MIYDGHLWSIIFTKNEIQEKNGLIPSNAGQTQTYLDLHCTGRNLEDL